MNIIKYVILNSFERRVMFNDVHHGQEVARGQYDQGHDYSLYWHPLPYCPHDCIHVMTGMNTREIIRTEDRDMDRDS